MPTSSRDRWLAVNYAATIFTSAFLLFQIQPLIGKYILPWFGGSPAVWTTCLLFFQTLLFAGYAYAHLIHSRWGPRQQAMIHMGFLAAAALMLGVLPSDRWQPQGYDAPVRSILMILTVSVGLPYFVLSSTGPLLQAWFARSFPGRMPYRLYALSNLGSLLALVSYPFYFESAFTLPRQAILWSAGFIVYALLCGYAAWRLWTGGDARSSRGVKSRRNSRPKTDEPPPAPGWIQYVLWLAWPALASVVLLATTNHVSTDIAAVPFLWVVPLALYLLTFIIAFDRPAWYRRAPVAVLMLAAIYGTGFMHGLGVGWKNANELGDAGMLGLFCYFLIDPTTEFHVATWQFLAVNFAAMFVICLLCHGELVRGRPHPNYLTAFYLMIAAGGALGGAFVTLVAPSLFVTVLEWRLALGVACLVGIGFVLRALVDFVFRDDDNRSRRLGDYVLLAGLVLGVFLPSAVMLLDLVEFLQPYTPGSIYRTRNFFGTLAVVERKADEPLERYHLLRHGAITHGAQFMHPDRRREPMTYYAPTSGAGLAIDHYRSQLQSEGMKLGVVGLGTGSLAAYAEKSDAVTFYEINPAVVEIAENNRWFTYLADCRQRGAECDIRLGDARLTLRRELHHNSPPLDGEGLGEETGQQYHVLVLDAFSGDAIPVHLLTVEAFELYLAHLAPPGGPAAPGGGGGEGAIAVHISNRYLNLEPLVRGIARHFGLRALYVENESDDENLVYSADWIVLTRNARLAEELRHTAKVPHPAAHTILWTDTDSSVLDVLQ